MANVSFQSAAPPVVSSMVLLTLIFLGLLGVHFLLFDTALNDADEVDELNEPLSRPLSFNTLVLDPSSSSKLVDHNCAMLTAADYPFLIHTVDTSASYCHTCRCVRYDPKNCACPHPDSEQDCARCESIHFFSHLLRTQNEFVYVGSDVTILHEDFVPALVARTTRHDFLAAAASNAAKYEDTIFRTDLMFVRRPEGSDTVDDLDGMYKSVGQNSEVVSLSRWVKRHYQRWDVLSKQWHCFNLWMDDVTIPLSRCLTFFANKGFRNALLDRNNITLRTTQDLTLTPS